MKERVSQMKFFLIKQLLEEKLVFLLILSLGSACVETLEEEISTEPSFVTGVSTNANPPLPELTETLEQEISQSENLATPEQNESNLPEDMQNEEGFAEAQPDDSFGDGQDEMNDMPQQQMNHPPTQLLVDKTASTNQVRIRDNPYGQAISLYSVHLPAVTAQDWFMINGEVYLSRCNLNDIEEENTNSNIAPCTSEELRNSPYDYQPVINVALFVSQSATELGTTPLTTWTDKRCSEARHHCVVSIPQTILESLPAGDHWIHIGVTAHADGDNAKRWHYMEVETEKGQLNVTRLTEGNEILEELSLSHTPTTSNLVIDQNNTELTYSTVYELSLNTVQPGDVVYVSSNFYSVLEAGGECEPAINTQIFLTQMPGESDPSRAIGYLTPKNGGKCPKHNEIGCGYGKAGAINIPQNMTPPLYIVQYVTAKRSCDRQESWHIRVENNGMNAVILR